jgi:hypothetical protein
MIRATKRGLGAAASACTAARFAASRAGGDVEQDGCLAIGQTVRCGRGEHGLQVVLELGEGLAEVGVGERDGNLLGHDPCES